MGLGRRDTQRPPLCPSCLNPPYPWPDPCPGCGFIGVPPKQVKFSLHEAFARHGALMAVLVGLLILAIMMDLG